MVSMTAQLNDNYFAGFTKQPSGKMYVSNAAEFKLTCVSEYATGITAAVAWDQTGAETTQVQYKSFPEEN